MSSDADSRPDPSPDRPVRLVVVFGGQSAEHDVSCVTASHVLAAADPARYRVEPVGITREGRWVRADDARRALEAGKRAGPEAVAARGTEITPQAAVSLAASDETVVVFPLLHGPMGEDGTVQGLLELAGVPYVGAGVLGSALAMDKLSAKEVVAHHGIPQAKWRGLRVTDRTDGTATGLVDALGLPLFVKPANMGSSIGVSKAHDLPGVRAALDVAFSYDEFIVAEEAIVGREIEVAVLGNTDLAVSVPGEIRPGAEFYDYDDKYLDGSADLIIPAELPDDVVTELGEVARRSFRALRVEGMGRVDFLYEEGGRGLLLNEINTIPGFTPISMYPKLWEASGLSYPRLIDELVDLALDRHQRRQAARRTTREAGSANGRGHDGDGGSG
jgi:D-alanine-D-alanine ligase